MKYSEAKLGRVFVMRLEDGDIVHETLETFAQDKGIRAATVTILGGADAGSRLIVGPDQGRADEIVPMEHELDNVHEIAGAGTIFPDSSGVPVLHMHIACGREGSTVTGCVRRGVKTWHVLEVVIQELVDCTSSRQLDSTTGFELLQP